MNITLEEAKARCEEAELRTVKAWHDNHRSKVAFEVANIDYMLARQVYLTLKLAKDSE